MASRNEIINDAIEIVKKSECLTHMTIDNAWIGIYQALLWYESIKWVGFEELPHIIDSNNLRPSTPAKRRSWKKPRKWQIRAKAIEDYLADTLNIAPEQVSKRVGLLFKMRKYKYSQKQNILGIAFSGILRYLLQQLGDKSATFVVEADASIYFSGISFPGMSESPKIDILVLKEEIPVSIISAKWSLRHDRIKDITNECPAYKSAFNRIYRSKKIEFKYFVATNEYGPARLMKIVDDNCVDGLIHVHKAGVVDVCKLNDRLTEMFDLSHLLRAVHGW